MNNTIKTLIRQVVPPVLVPLGKALLQRKEPEDQRVSALRALHERMNKNLGEDEMRLREEVKLKLHPESREAFEHFCYRAPMMVEELDCFIEQTKDKHHLLDVGALHGMFALIFAARSPVNQAVAVDPSPVAFARLLYNIHKNRLANIVPKECALSENAGTITMHYEWEHAVAAAVEDPHQKYLTVEKTTGDDLCESLRFNPDVIKIDVEGHEIKVIKGLARTIQRLRPLIFLELHPGRIIQEKDAVADAVSILTACGYRAAAVSGRPINLSEMAAFTEDQRLVLKPAT